MTAYDTFRRWYIDGRLFYHCIINETKPDAGIIRAKTNRSNKDS